MLANQQNSITNAGYVKIRLIGLKSTNQCVKQNNFSALVSSESRTERKLIL